MCHFGPSGMAGHFIAFCKSPVNHKWYCYNDATVTECEGDPEIKSYGNVEGIPYVLYYQRYQNNQGQNNNFNNNNFNININNKFSNNNNNNAKINNFFEDKEATASFNNNKKTIYLKFMYNDKDYDLEIKRKSTIEDMIIQLHKKYKIPKDVMVLSEKTNMVPYKLETKINDTNLNNNDILIIIDL